MICMNSVFLFSLHIDLLINASSLPLIFFNRSNDCLCQESWQDTRRPLLRWVLFNALIARWRFQVLALYVYSSRGRFD